MSEQRQQQDSHHIAKLLGRLGWTLVDPRKEEELPACDVSGLVVEGGFADVHSLLTPSPC